jgi:hypothetical protein
MAGKAEIPDIDTTCDAACHAVDRTKFIKLIEKK